ncbi:acetyl-CoA C-acetyltransferase [Castellaniella sp.]|uniref:acetyl-CoA C-acetyltransferase n=1 Tax=Castellaniella sp. TaxID=1955812 RepID=UPI00355F23CB
MNQAYIVAARRTAGGRRKGRLAGWHPVEMAARIIDALMADLQADPALVDDVIMGCVSQIGEQSTNVGRNAVLASCLPESVPGTSVDRQCGSSQQAVHFAAQAVMSGAMDMVIAAGVESMTRVPMGSPVSLAQQAGFGHHQSAAIMARYGQQIFSQFTGAEMMARKYGLTRADLDAYALESHRRGAATTQAGHFATEILPLPVLDADGQPSGDLHAVDEGIRFDASASAMAAMAPLQDSGLLTAASASQMCDGAAGVVIVNERGLAQLNVEPLARIHHMTVLGHDPAIMLEAPIPATRLALQRAGMRLDDISLYEVNEAFASIPLAWQQALNADPDRMNAWGGAIALGHPLGATGAKLMTTLVHALRRQGGRYGLQTMCEGGGLANVTVIERL